MTREEGPQKLNFGLSGCSRVICSLALRYGWQSTGINVYTLHEDILRILFEAGPRGLPVPELARIIQERRLYMQSSGRPASTQQVYARIHRYAHLFEIDKSTHPLTVRLRVAVPPRRPFSSKSSETASDPAVVDGEQQWFWEGNVQARIRSHLEAEGWKIRRAADTANRERGADLLAVRGERERTIEVKGYPSTVYERGVRKGQKKKTRPSVQATHWYAQALLSALILQASSPESEVFVGLPDVPRYRTLLATTEPGLRKLGVGIYFVTKDGNVREHLKVDSG